MSTTKLIIEFGGLCMFVRQDTSMVHSLYVLMPKMTSGVTPHCPMLLVPQASTTTKADLYSLKDWSIDLSHLRHFTDPNQKPGPFNFALDVSAYTNTQVEDNWRTEMKDPLRARIRLPLEVSVSPLGPLAQIVVEDVQDPVSAAGRAKVEITLTDFDDNVLQVGPAIVDMTAPTVTLYVLNIQRCDLHRTKPRSHSNGDKIKHPMAYYSLLNGEPKGKDFKVGTVIPGQETDNSICLPEPCMDGHHVVDFTPPQPLQARWVDTHDCAIGTGVF